MPPALRGVVGASDPGAGGSEGDLDGGDVREAAVLVQALGGRSGGRGVAGGRMGAGMGGAGAEDDEEGVGGWPRVGEGGVRAGDMGDPAL